MSLIFALFPLNRLSPRPVPRGASSTRPAKNQAGIGISPFPRPARSVSPTSRSRLLDLEAVSPTSLYRAAAQVESPKKVSRSPRARLRPASPSAGEPVSCSSYLTGVSLMQSRERVERVKRLWATLWSTCGNATARFQAIPLTRTLPFAPSVRVKGSRQVVHRIALLSTRSGEPSDVPSGWTIDTRRRPIRFPEADAAACGSGSRGNGRERDPSPLRAESGQNAPQNRLIALG